ncbi:MAG: stage II sporulation protein M [Nanoarchaeota archaeon]|nr:stage II sporulation protein M [Nanoarchaeota archaeon]
MLEMILGPRKAERHPWEMFIIGLLYASLSVLLVSWIFGQDAVLSKYSGILIVTFTVMFSIPFMYYIIKLEEEKDLQENIGFLSLLKEHSKALKAFTWLFLGFVVAFSFWYIVLPSSDNFRAQIETYCWINRPANFEQCISDYGVEVTSKTTGFATNKERLFMIFSNNIYVMIFTLIFSLIFGAGAIFILAWNASVIAAAIGIFSKESLAYLPVGLGRYMIHGLPEILAYFIAALAGGILSIAIIRHDFKGDKFWKIIQDSLNLVILAVVVLFIAGLIEVFITPILF